MLLNEVQKQRREILSLKADLEVIRAALARLATTRRRTAFGTVDAFQVGWPSPYFKSVPGPWGAGTAA
jgi:hypothetical protein